MVVRHYTDRGVVPELGATATSRDAVRLPAVPLGSVGQRGGSDRTTARR
jgi:hypothetical protein